MSEGRTHYEVLGLTPDASPDEVKKRYRELARRYHPDLNRDHPEYHAIFLRINQAYEALGDPNRRAAYDLDLRARERREAEQRGGSFGSAPGAARPHPGARAPGGNGAARPGTAGARSPRERREAEERKRRAARLLDEARMAYSRGHLREAQRLCEEVLQNARLGGAYEILGDVYSRQGRFADAVQQYTVAAQLLPHQGLIMAKLNRAVGHMSGTRPSRGPAARPAANRPRSLLDAVGRLVYRLVLATLGASLVLFLMYWWPHLHDARLELPVFTNWTLSQLIVTALDGFIAGMILASTGFIRPFTAEMTVHPLTAPRRRAPLNLVLSLFAFVSLPLALVVYLIISYLQGYVSYSVLTAFGVAAAMTFGFFSAAPPMAQLETLAVSGNILFLTLLLGWYVGDLFRPRWAY